MCNAKRAKRRSEQREPHKKCDEGKNNLFARWQTSCEREGEEAKGHPGEAEQGKIVRYRKKTSYLNQSGTQTAVDVEVVEAGGDITASSEKKLPAEMLAEENSGIQTAVEVVGRRRQSELGDDKNLRNLTIEMGYVLVFCQFRCLPQARCSCSKNGQGRSARNGEIPYDELDIQG